MNILNLFRKKGQQEEPAQQAEPVQQEEPAQQRDGGYLPEYWGNTITIDTGATNMPMKIATVYRCVDILSGSIASLSLQIRRKKITKVNEVTGEASGYFVIDTENPINTLLNIAPNLRMNSFELMKNAISQMLLRGNSYVLPQYGHGLVSSLVLLTPNSVTYDKNYNRYHVCDIINNIYGDFFGNEIIHLRNTSIDGGYAGISTIEYASTVLGIASSADRQSNDIFQPGSTSRGFLSGDESTTKGFGEVQDAQLETVGSRVESELRGGKKIMYIPGSMKFNPLSMSPADLQLLDSKKFTVLEICRFFGVHPDKVFAGQSTNYKASAMSQIQYLTDTLQPFLRKIENEFTVKLIPRNLYSTQKIQFNMDDYYQTDLTAKSDYQMKTIQNGIYTVNEWRNKEGLDGVDGGDQTLVSCNLAPINSAKIKGEQIAIPTQK